MIKNNKYFSKISFDLINAILIFIYLYSFIDKLKNFQEFVSNLSKSPYLNTINSLFLAVVVLFFEIFIPIFLFFDKSKELGYLLSFLMIFSFTGYIVIMMVYSPYLPCSCGGFIESLSWEGHLFLNLFILFISAIAYLNYSKNT
jgi:hypothetical protein